MRLLRFGRRVINISALLEAVPSSDGTKLYMWMAAPGPESTFLVELRDHEVEAFYTWLEDNSDLVTSIPLAHPRVVDLDPDDGHDTSIPF